MKASLDFATGAKWIAVAMTLLIAGCGIDQGGYRDPASSDSQQHLLAISGPIDAFGSISVNGLVLDTSQAQIRVDGVAATQADLRAGQVIRAIALVTSSSTRALSIDYEENVVGPVASIDAPTGELIVLGQRVRVAAATRFDGVNLDSLGDLLPGDLVAVSGITLPSGGVLATFVGRAASSEPFEVTAPITAIGAAGFKFDLGSLTIDYSQVALLDVPNGLPVPDLVVEVTGTSVNNGELVADRVRALPLLPGAFTGAATALTAAEIPAAALAPVASQQPLATSFVGLISARPTSATLRLLDLEVGLTSATAIAGGNADALVTGTRVLVEGRVIGPGRVTATRIAIQQ